MPRARLNCEGVLQEGTRNHGWRRLRRSWRRGKKLHMPSRESSKPAGIEAAREQSQAATVQSAARCAACSTHDLQADHTHRGSSSHLLQQSSTGRAIKLDRRLESAGHGRARQRRNEEQRTHLFNPVTCTAEACHIRWAASLKKVLGLSTLAALAPPCTQRPGCHVEVHIARGRHDLCMAIAKNHGIRKLMSNDQGTRRSFSHCMNSMPP